ncbi:unnamed protein product [Arctia plantaginis]|uniref:Uncharacterized protein n=1 Tax=Arctia plantaginis TaxID=874455 RepID=A0A8S0YTE8_ARCPL|nr:unnamed protein product [Arctia plantaginis]
MLKREGRGTKETVAKKTALTIARRGRLAAVARGPRGRAGAAAVRAVTSRVISTPVRVSSRPATPSALLHRPRTTDTRVYKQTSCNYKQTEPPPCCHYGRAHVHNRFHVTSALATSTDVSIKEQ